VGGKIGRHHFPADLRILFVAAKSKTQQEIRGIVAQDSDGEIARAYRKGVELTDGQALHLARRSS
jgi:hypothetical protein